MKKDNSEKGAKGKRTMLEMKHQQNDKSEQESFETRHFWKWQL